MAYIPAIGLAILLSKGAIKQKTSRILLIAAGLVVVLAPWSIRNHNALGTWSFGSTLSGYNVLRHNSVLSEEDIYQYVGPNEAHELVLDLITDHPELRGDENEKEMNSLYMEAGLESISAHPWNYIKLSFYRLFVMWTNWKVSDSSNRASGIEDHAMSIQQIIFLLLGLLSLKIRTGFERAIVFTILFYCALHMGVVCRIRYLLPLMPILLLFVGRTLDRWITPSKV